MLNIDDHVTRECIGAMVETSISRQPVVRELGQLITTRGAAEDDRQGQQRRPDLEVGNRQVGRGQAYDCYTVPPHSTPG